VAFLFRIATFEIADDDYLHLAAAQQILLGDVPGRDFIDPGEPLSYYVSAAAQATLGRTVLSEVLLDVAGLALAYVFIVLLGARLAGSWLAALATFPVALLLVPRLYAYPKLLVYAIGLWLVWRYGDLPRTTRLWAVATWCVVAALFRHDHGAYLALTMGVMLVLVHAPDGWSQTIRKLTTFAAGVLVLFSPYLLFLALHGGVAAHVRGMLAIARAEYERTEGDYPTFRASLAVPRVTIGWGGDVGAAQRATLEASYSLSRPEQRGDGLWDYDLNDTSRRNVAALADDRRVSAIERLDRERMQIRVPVREPNRLAWFYYLTFAMAPFALLLKAHEIRRRGHWRLEAHDRWLLSAAVLSMVMNVYLMRSASDSAVGDVSALTTIVGTYLLAAGVRGMRTLSPHRLAGGVLTMLVFGTCVFFALRDNGGFALSQAVVMLQDEGFRGIAGKMAGGQRLAPPFDRPLERYLWSCTSPSDRVLVSGYAPETFYGSGRGFAGGRPYFIGNYAPLPAQKAFSLSRFENEQVPVVVIRREDEAEFSASFPALAALIRRNYREAGGLADDPDTRIFTRADLVPLATYEDGALPCFR